MPDSKWPSLNIGASIKRHLALVASCWGTSNELWALVAFAVADVANSVTSLDSLNLIVKQEVKISLDSDSERF